MSDQEVQEWVTKAETDKAPFPKIHDLIALKKLCVEKEGAFELIHDLLESLEGYDVAVRYPSEAATVEDARQAVAAMKGVRRFVRARLGNITEKHRGG